jgi:hypothetical protein
MSKSKKSQNFYGIIMVNKKTKIKMKCVSRALNESGRWMFEKWEMVIKPWLSSYDYECVSLLAAAASRVLTTLSLSLSLSLCASYCTSFAMIWFLTVP